MSQPIPEGWLKEGRREYGSRTLDVDVEVKPTADQSGDFEIRFEADDEVTVVGNRQPNEKAALDRAKDVIRTFNEAFDAARDEGADEDEAIERAIERAVAEHQA
ncbi:MAG: hypothetical protein ABEI80_08295 [Haloplanus sp.]